MYEEQFPPPASPRPFGEIPGLWTKVFQMTEQFFAQEAVRASGSNTLISVLIMGVVSSVLATISSLIWGGTQMAFLPPEYREAMAVGAGSNVVCSLCSTLIGTAIGFYLSNGLVYLGARIFGGTGDFTTQAYLASLFAVPVGIVSGLVGLVPCVGLIAVLAVSVWRRLDPLRAALWLFGVLVIVSPIVHPWYFLWVLPFAAARREWPWLILGAALPLAYLPLDEWWASSTWRVPAWVPWVEYGSFFGVLIARFAWLRWGRGTVRGRACG